MPKQTHPRKDIVTTNALLVDSNSQLSSDEKKKWWKLGRASENVKNNATHALCTHLEEM